SCPKASPGTCVNEASDCRLPASNSTTLMPRRVSSCASVPPPAPEPMMTTTPSSFSSNFAMRVSPSALLDHGAAVGQRHIGQPTQVVEPAEQVAALRERLALIAEVFVRVLRCVEAEHFRAQRLEERRLLDL